MSDKELIISVTIIAVLIVLIAGRKKRKLQRYRKIKLGMTEKEVLKIMGHSHSVGRFSDDAVIYEWSLPATTYVSSYHGLTHKGEKSVTVYIKNGVVEGVKSENI